MPDSRSLRWCRACNSPISSTRRDEKLCCSFSSWKLCYFLLLPLHKESLKVRQCIAEHRHSRNVYTLRVVIKIHEAKFLREKMFKGSVRVACHVVRPFIIAIPIVPTLVWRMGVWTPVKDCTTAADPELHKWATNCQQIIVLQLLAMFVYEFNTPRRHLKSLPLCKIPQKWHAHSTIYAAVSSTSFQNSHIP